MPITRSDFSGPGDLRAMQAMCSRAWSPHSRFHAGQLAWNRYAQPVDPARPGSGEAISLWWADGQVVGFAWAESADWLELQIDATRPDVAEEVAEDVIAWFEDWSDAPRQTVHVMVDDPSETALVAAGFRAERDAWHFTHHVLSLSDLSDLPALPALPRVAGYTLRPVRSDETAERAAVHRSAWSDIGAAELTTGAYEQLRRAWPYRPELDWVVANETGELVASVIVWLDGTTGVALVEPVGCVPAERGRGLARAVTVAALHRARELGAHTALVTTGGDADDPGPRRLYETIGFRPVARTVTWTRSLD